jgi:hypothetical protein
MKKTLFLPAAALLAQLAAYQPARAQGAQSYRMTLSADGGAQTKIAVSAAQEIIVRSGTMTVNMKSGDPVNGIKEIAFSAAGVGIESAAAESAVFAYPNPVRDYLTVSGIEADLAVNVFDMNGKLLQTAVSKGSAVDINVSSLPAGVYLLRVRDNVIKFTKQ